MFRVCKALHAVQTEYLESNIECRRAHGRRRCKKTLYPLLAAAKRGHYNCFRYLLQYRSTTRRVELSYMKSQILLTAAKNGNIDILKYAVEHGFPLGYCSHICTMMSHQASRTDIIDILEWMFAKGARVNSETASTAAQLGRIDLLEWLLSKGCTMNSQSMWIAAANGQLHVLEWGRAHGVPWDFQVCVQSAKNGHIHILKYALQNGAAWRHPEIRDIATRSGHTNVLRLCDIMEKYGTTKVHTAGVPVRVDHRIWLPHIADICAEIEQQGLN